MKPLLINNQTNLITVSNCFTLRQQTQEERPAAFTIKAWSVTLTHTHTHTRAGAPSPFHDVQRSKFKQFQSEPSKLFPNTSTFRV